MQRKERTLKSTNFIITTSILSMFATSAALAVSTGQIDTFENGTTENWVVNLLGSGSPPPAALPVNVPTDGPAGDDDNYLLLTALGGAGSGNRLSVINFMNQWAGDYVGSGIDGIRMHVNNLGTSDLDLRLMFADPTLGPPENIAFSTDAIHVPAGSGWTRIEFPVLAVDLTAGIGNVIDALRHTTEVRLYHSTDPNFPNPVFPIESVTAQLGVDNIQAVPETPSTAMLLGCGMLTLILAQRSQTRMRQFTAEDKW